MICSKVFFNLLSKVENCTYLTVAYGNSEFSSKFQLNLGNGYITVEIANDNLTKNGLCKKNQLYKISDDISPLISALQPLPAQFSSVKEDVIDRLGLES